MQVRGLRGYGMKGERAPMGPDPVVLTRGVFLRLRTEELLPQR